MCVYCNVLVFCCVFFFFKQKTAYEMRISDWSSDVCSSDLHAPAAAVAGAVGGRFLADAVQGRGDVVGQVVHAALDAAGVQHAAVAQQFGEGAFGDRTGEAEAVEHGRVQLVADFAQVAVGAGHQVADRAQALEHGRVAGGEFDDAQAGGDRGTRSVDSCGRINV